MFLVFAGEDYYPVGGIDDLHSKHETIEGAKSVTFPVEDPDSFSFDGYEWAHIFDTEKMIVVAETETIDENGKPEW